MHRDSARTKSIGIRIWLYTCRRGEEFWKIWEGGREGGREGRRERGGDRGRWRETGGMG